MLKSAKVVFVAGLLTACSSDLPHEAPFDPNAPLEKQAKASLSGTIELAGETDFSQVTLDLQNADRTYNVDTAADGAVSLTGIVPGEYALKIRTRYFEPVEDTLTVEMGSTIDLGTRTLAPLSSRVLGQATAEKIQGTELITKGGVALTLRKTASVRTAVAKGPAFRTAAVAATGVTLRTVSGNDGGFEFGEVPAGGYELSAASDDAEERVVGTVTVTGEGDVTVDPIVLRPLTGYFEILGSANGVQSSTYTSIAAVNLQLQQSNAVQVKVAVSTDGSTTGCDLANAASEALPSNTLRPLTFTTEGKKLVCVSYVDADGKETAPIYGSITYDATPPTLPSVAINGGAQVVSSNLVTLSISAVDALSGVAVHKVHGVNDFSAVSPKPYQPTDVYSLTTVDGQKTVWVVFGDHAGNYSTPVSASVLLDTTPPAVSGGVTLAKLDGTPLTSGDTIAEGRVKITSTVNEATPVLEMQITTTGSYAGQSWVPYDAAKTIDLPSGASTISVRVRDGAGHVVDLVTAFTLTTDTTPPTGTLVIAPSAVTNPAITVQATGDADAVAVELAFDPGFVTSLGNFVPGPIAVTLLAGDGVKTVYGRFFDAAGNTSTLVGDTVTLDTTPPQILSFTIAQASPTKDNPVTVNYSVAGAAELRITEGAECGGARESVGAGSKNFTVSSPEGSKEIRLQFFDAAGNASECAVRAIAYDPNPPVVGTMQLNYGQAATSSNVVTVSFTGVSGATKVILSEDAGFAGADWQTYAGTKTFVLSAGNGVKTVYAKVADDAGHVINVPQATITLDTSTPIAPSIYAAVDVTTQTSVLLTLAAGVVQDMWLTQDDPNFTTGAWEPFVGSKVFTLSGADGTKTIYAKFRKANLTETVVVSDTVILDRTAPTLPIVRVDGNATVVASASVVLNLSAVDASSGLSTYKINTVNDFTAISAEPFQSNVLYGLSGPDGLKTIWVTIGDKAGIYSAPVSTTVTLDTSAPAVNSAAVQTTGGTPLTTGSTIAATRVVLATSVSDLSALQMQVSTTGSFAGAVWETYTPSKSIDLPAGPSTIAARVRDAAGHVSDLITSFSITVDNTPPTSPSLAINGKTAGAVSTPTVSVTLSVSGDAIDAEIAYDPGFVTSLGSFAPNATHNVPLLAGDGSKSLYVRFFDAAGNESVLAGDTVILDTTPPIASFTIAEASPTKINPFTLNYTQAGATNFRVAEDAACGGALEAVGSGTRAFTVSASEGSKEVRMQFFDAVGNASACLVQSVYFDPNPPVIGSLQINYGQAATSSNVVTLSFPGVSGATKVMVSEDAGFAGADWQAFAATKTFTLSPGNGVKAVYAKVADDAGHVVNLTQQSITLDTTPPTNPSIFAAYDVTSQTSVTVFLSAGLVSEMWITQDDPTFTTGAWETYSGSKLFALSGTDGTKTIYAKFKKSTGVETAVVSDTVILDRTAPILPSLQVNGGASVVTSNIVALNLSAVDSASGLYTYKVNDTNDFTALSPKPYQTSDVYALAGGDGAKTVWVAFGDRAGHYSAAVSKTVLLDTTPPNAISSVISKLDGSPISPLATIAENRIVLTSAVTDLSALEMQVTTNGSFSGVAWEPYAANKIIDLVGGSATISARVRDGAGLTTNLITGFGLSVDTAAPSLALTRTSVTPTNDLTITLSLASSESGEAQVSADPGFGDAVWFAVADTSITLTPGDGLRTIYARARDGAGNLSAVKTVTVYIDRTPPQLAAFTINGGSLYAQNGLLTLAFSGLDIDQYRAAEDACGGTYGGHSGSATFALAPGDGVRTIAVQFRDAVGNETACLTQSITLDTQPPGTPSLAINGGGAYTTTRVVSLALGTATGATEMQIAENAAFLGASWQPVTTAVAWTLSTGEGAKTVYVRARDAAGNLAPEAQAAVILDTVPPEQPILVVGSGSGYVTSATVNIQLGATGSPAYYRAVTGSSIESAAWLPYVTLSPINLGGGGDGLRTVTAQFRDEAGNPSALASAAVYLDSNAPSAGTLRIDDGALYTKDPLGSVTLALSALETGSGLATVSLAPSLVGLNAATPVPFEPTKLFTLDTPGVDGVKTVWARFADRAGNFSAPVSGYIVLDRLPPAAVLASMHGGLVTSNLVPVSIAADPDTEAMMLSNDPGFVTTAWEPLRNPVLWEFPNAPGVVNMYARFRDVAGNVSGSFGLAVTIDSTPPSIQTVRADVISSKLVWDHYAPAASYSVVAYNPDGSIGSVTYTTQKELAVGAMHPGFSVHAHYLDGERSNPSYAPGYYVPATVPGLIGLHLDAAQNAILTRFAQNYGLGTTTHACGQINFVRYSAEYDWNGVPSGVYPCGRGNTIFVYGAESYYESLPPAQASVLPDPGNPLSGLTLSFGGSPITMYYAGLRTTLLELPAGVKWAHDPYPSPYFYSPQPLIQGTSFDPFTGGGENAVYFLAPLGGLAMADDVTYSVTTGYNLPITSYGALGSDEVSWPLSGQLAGMTVTAATYRYWAGSIVTLNHLWDPDTDPLAAIKPGSIDFGYASAGDLADPAYIADSVRTYCGPATYCDYGLLTRVDPATSTIKYWNTDTYGRSWGGFVVANSTGTRFYDFPTPRNTYGTFYWNDEWDQPAFADALRKLFERYAAPVRVRGTGAGLLTSNVAGAVQMRVSYDGDFSSIAWQPYADEVTIPAGVETVWVEYQDEAGNVTTTDAIVVTVPAQAPRIDSVSIAGAGAEPGFSTQQGVTATLTGNLAPGMRVRASQNPVFADDEWQPLSAAGTVQFTLPPANGRYWYYFWAADASNNYSPPISASVLFDNAAPSTAEFSLIPGAEPHAILAQTRWTVSLEAQRPTTDGATVVSAGMHTLPFYFPYLGVTNATSNQISLNATVACLFISSASFSACPIRALERITKMRLKSSSGAVTVFWEGGDGYDGPVTTAVTLTAAGEVRMSYWRTAAKIHMSGTADEVFTPISDWRYALYDGTVVYRPNPKDIYVRFTAGGADHKVSSPPTGSPWVSVMTQESGETTYTGTMYSAAGAAGRVSQRTVVVPGDVMPVIAARGAFPITAGKQWAAWSKNAGVERGAYHASGRIVSNSATMSGPRYGTVAGPDASAQNDSISPSAPLRLRAEAKLDTGVVGVVPDLDAGLLYGADGSIWDALNPASPKPLYQVPGYWFGGVGQSARWKNELWTANGIYDISTPSAPVFVVASPAAAEYQLAYRGYMYAIVGGALRTYDIATRTQVASTGTSLRGPLTRRGQKLYIRGTTTSRVYIYDVAAPAAPVLVTSISGATGYALEAGVEMKSSWSPMIGKGPFLAEISGNKLKPALGESGSWSWESGNSIGASGTELSSWGPWVFAMGLNGVQVAHFGSNFGGEPKKMSFSTGYVAVDVDHVYVCEEGELAWYDEDLHRVGGGPSECGALTVDYPVVWVSNQYRYDISSGVPVESPLWRKNAAGTDAKLERWGVTYRLSGNEWWPTPDRRIEFELPECGQAYGAGDLVICQTTFPLPDAVYGTTWTEMRYGGVVGAAIPLPLIPLVTVTLDNPPGGRDDYLMLDSFAFMPPGQRYYYTPTVLRQPTHFATNLGGLQGGDFAGVRAMRGTTMQIVGSGGGYLAPDGKAVSTGSGQLTLQKWGPGIPEFRMGIEQLTSVNAVATASGYVYYGNAGGLHRLAPVTKLAEVNFGVHSARNEAGKIIVGDEALRPITSATRAGTDTIADACSLLYNGFSWFCSPESGATQIQWAFEGDMGKTWLGIDGYVTAALGNVTALAADVGGTLFAGVSGAGQGIYVYDSNNPVLTQIGALATAYPVAGLAVRDDRLYAHSTTNLYLYNANPLTPTLSNSVALSIDAVRVNGDEVAVRSGGNILRLNPTTLATMSSCPLVGTTGATKQFALLRLQVGGAWRPVAVYGRSLTLYYLALDTCQQLSAQSWGSSITAVRQQDGLLWVESSGSMTISSFSAGGSFMLQGAGTITGGIILGPLVYTTGSMAQVFQLH